MKLKLLSGAALALSIAGLSLTPTTAANAAVVITASNCAGCENVHLIPDVGPADFFAYGELQSSGVTVKFTGIENIATGSGNGVAWVQAIDGGLTYLDVAIQPGYGFTSAGFNLNDLPGDDDWFVKVSAFDGATLKQSAIFTESHDTKFEIEASGLDSLTHFQIQLLTDGTGANLAALNGNLELDAVGQIKIDGVAQRDVTPGTQDFGVPEPGTWALLIMGMGGVGAALRSRRKVALA